MFDTLLPILSLDFPPILCALFAGLTCAIIGNYLLLQRISMVGDAISHTVLPGIVGAFLLTQSRGGMILFVGAAVSGVITTLLISAVKRLANVDSGAAIGVVFSTLFALGILMLEQAAASNVDLDADCVLYGQLEALFWFPPNNINDFFTLNTLTLLPTEVYSTMAAFVATVVATYLLRKELILTSFDPAMATALGFSAKRLNLILMILTAGAVVASFEAVGSILVIGMLVCPAATARLIADSVKGQFSLSVIFSIISVFSGYLFANLFPQLIGLNNSFNAAGSIVCISGLILLVVAVVSPTHGILGKRRRLDTLATKIASEDLLAWFYRQYELCIESNNSKNPLFPKQKALESALPTRTKTRRVKALRKLSEIGDLIQQDNKIKISSSGINKGKELIRNHRLWESYLVTSTNIATDHVHDPAERLEHFTSKDIQEKLKEKQGDINVDPHGRDIP